MGMREVLPSVPRFLPPFTCSNSAGGHGGKAKGNAAGRLVLKWFWFWFWVGPWPWPGTSFQSARPESLLSPDRLLSLTLLAFEGLNTAASKDQCVARLEEAFFAPLWTPLLAVYR